MKAKQIMNDKKLRAKNLRAGMAFSLVILASIALTIAWALHYAAL
jgi:hypothetical protein